MIGQVIRFRCFGEEGVALLDADAKGERVRFGRTVIGDADNILLCTLRAGVFQTVPSSVSGRARPSSRTVSKVIFVLGISRRFAAVIVKRVRGVYGDRSRSRVATSS